MNHELTPVFDDGNPAKERSEQLLDRIVTYEDFAQFVETLDIDEDSLEQTTNETWEIGQEIYGLQLPMLEDQPEVLEENVLDLGAVLDYMKLVVKGMMPLQSKGYKTKLNQTSWTIFSGLIQQRFPDDE